MQLLVDSAASPPAPPTGRRTIPAPETPTPAAGWRARRRVRQQVAALESSPLFDAPWYVATYPETAAVCADPVLHYILHGAGEGRDPGPAFSTLGYYEANPDVAEAGFNPLAHYLSHGRAEGRALHPGIAAGHRARRRGPLARARLLLATVRRTLLRPRSRFQPVQADGVAGEAWLRRLEGRTPTGWCLVERPHRVVGAPLILRVFQDGPTLEVVLGGRRGRDRVLLTRLPPPPLRLGLRRDAAEGSDHAPDVVPEAITFREIGRAEVAARLLARVLAQPRALFGAARRGRAVALLRETAANTLPREPTGYQTWVRLHDTPSRGQVAAMRARARAMREPPRFAVLVPTFNTPPTALREMLASVRGQSYPHWELCVADDASTRPHVRTILRDAAAEEPRIRLHLRERNGNIAAASNSALALARGDFAALLDHDDVLPGHALLTMADAIAAEPRADLLYSDEDKLDAEGLRYDPYFKPDYSPELLQAQNFVSHLGVYRLATLRDVGGFREGFEGSQDYDLALRVAAVTRAPVVHVPHILYHWRLYPGAGTFSSTQVARATQAARRALVEDAAARGETVTVTDGVGYYHRVRRADPGRWPAVTAIVPTRDHVDVLRECIDGLRAGTDYPTLEIVVVDNGSVEERTHAYLAELAAQGVRVLPFPGPFNYSAINNAAARVAQGELLLLLNSDVSMVDRDWLRAMVQQARGPRVGAVGARLLYPDHTVQHAGVVLGLGGAAGHVHLGATRADPGYFGQLMIAREVSAVTAACVLVPRERFWEVGGLDEVNLPVAFNDVDFCLRLREGGWRIVWTPHAELVHHESKSRGSDFTPERIDKFHAEVAYMRGRWGELLRNDPFFNPNLSLDHPKPTPAFPPRVARPWEVAESAAGTQRRAAEAAAVT